MVVVLSITAMAPAAFSESLRLHKTLSDHMVVQRDRPIPIGGWARPGQTVTVTVTVTVEGDSTLIATALVDEKGRWRATLPARAVGEPFSILVASGGKRLELKNVLAGDVWLVAGQSNMNYTASRSPLVADWMDQLDAWPTVRYLKLKPVPATEPRDEPELDGGKAWFAVDAKNAGPCSAVGLIFGVELSQAMGVPVGLIQAARGGTPIESWMSPGSLKSYLEVDASQSTGGRAHAAYFNTMIHPLADRPIRGVAWYQGESSAYDPGTYRRLLPAMITGYRHHFDSPEAVFAVVQLPSFGGEGWPTRDECWPWLREVQQQVADEMDGVELAVTLDQGEFNDIHPPQKVEVGQRLAQAAMRVLQPENVLAPPRMRSVTFEQGKARVGFSDYVAGLETRRVVMNQQANQPPREDPQALVAPADEVHGFTIAGADGRFVEARAEIVRHEGQPFLTIQSPDVSDPVAVRYGWANFTLANVFDAFGNPLRPFRSDDWPLPPELAAAITPERWDGQPLPGTPGTLAAGDDAKLLKHTDDKPGIKTGPIDPKRLTLLSIRVPEQFRNLPPNQTVRLRLLIHDDRTTPLEIRYDSNDKDFKLSPASPPGLWKLARPVVMAGSGEWRVLNIDLPHARFGGRANGYDVRLALNPNYTNRPALRVAEARFETVTQD